VGIADVEAFDLLGEEVHFARIIAGEAFEYLGECAFGAVVAINEGRDDG
jgi:hypothetical protein